ncbi:MAG TPA: hypothetical protein VG347_00685 [Verrucomicrobiae bacterium]|nr:hypothetical protein [Verrucomicrobiae bacterium]
MLLLRSAVFICCTAFTVAAGNLLVNGDFEGGNTGFSSDYAYVPGHLDQSVYDIVPSPRVSHPYGANFPDHTSGHGFMLAANGSDDSHKAVWRQTVAVNPFQEYAFSGWAASWGMDWGRVRTDDLGLDVCPSQLRISINGVDCGSLVQLSATNGQWKFFARVWNSGAATSANIEIRLATTDANGNDMVLDDLAFSPGTSTQTPAQRTLSTPGGTDGTGAGNVSAEASVVAATPNPVAGVQIYRAVEIAWPSVSNQVYQVQWSSDMSGSNWADFQNPVIGNGTTNVVFDTVGAQVNRFYRVMSF